MSHNGNTVKCMLTSTRTKQITSQTMLWSKHNQEYKKKMLRYIKTIISLVKRLTIVAKCYLNWVIFMVPFYCCFRYLNKKYKYEIFKTYH